MAAVVARHPLALILALAFALRLPFAFIPAYAHPDEIFQHIEQAHRLVTGYGLIPWEYRDGIRSWFLPMLLSPLIWVHDLLGLEGSDYVIAIRIVFVLLSLAVVASFYGIGRRFSSTHGLLAGFVGAVWFELIYYSSHTLGESASLAAFMPAAWLLLDARTAPPRRMIAAGFLLGIAVLLRFQLLPAAGVLVLLTCALRIRQAWLPLSIGGLIALGLGAAADMSQGAVPFSWLVGNFAANIVDGRASGYGTSGPHFYLGAMLIRWNTLAILLVPLALVGARRYPALFLTLAVHLLVHTLIGHKEYRFILLTSAGITLFAAIGFADAVLWIKSRLPQHGGIILTAAFAFWLLNSLLLSFGESYRYRWFDHYPALAATAEAGRIPGLCGAALHLHFSDSGGYSYLHRQVPLYEILPKDKAQIRRGMAAFNAIVAPPSAAADLPANYRQVRCFEPLPRNPLDDARDAGATCLFIRPGTCTSVPELPTINVALRVRNE